jgi:hypothetical protein
MEHLATLCLCGTIGLLLIMRVYERADRPVSVADLPPDTGAAWALF